jgi:hypothetical protein
MASPALSGPRSFSSQLPSKSRHAHDILCAIVNIGQHFDRLQVQLYQKLPLPPTVTRSALQSNPSAGNEEGNTMQGRRTERPTQNQVMAVFKRSALSFNLPRSATHEDLAGRLAHLSETHSAALTSVSIRVSTQMRAD